MKDLRGKQVVDSQTKQTIAPIEEGKELVLISPEVQSLERRLADSESTGFPV